MKLKNIIFPIISIAILILELLPFGVVLNFANPEGEPWRHTYSYFNLTPFGYANFGPFLTAILTCILIVLTFLLFFKENKAVLNAMRIVSAVAVFTSLMPVFLGMNYVTPIGMIIFFLLFIQLGISFFIFEKQ